MKPEDARSVEDLKTILNQGGKLDYLFFWGHTPEEEGVIDQSCFSNWYPSEFKFGIVPYPTVEHLMMEAKAVLFGDEETAKKIYQAKTPYEAKRLGREVSGFNLEIWEQYRFDVVSDACLAKFSQNVELGNFLMNTGSKVIVEASPSDPIWGIGLRENDENATNPFEWEGLNLLGFALMRVRSILWGLKQAVDLLVEDGTLR
jgi:ribA/ribD-fused uncharacterized protein